MRQSFRIFASQPALQLFTLIFVMGCAPSSPPVATEAPTAEQLVGPSSDADAPWTINGVVVDEKGELVDEFEAATEWSSNGTYWNEAGIVSPNSAEHVWQREGVLASRPAVQAQKTGKGTFSVTVKDRPRVPVFVVNKDRTQGGLTLVERGQSNQTTRIQLGPLVRVTAEIYCPETGKSPAWSIAEVYMLGGDRIPLTKCGTFKGKVSFLLPPGEYAVTASSDDLPARTCQVTIPSAATQFDIGVIELLLPKGAEGKAVNIQEYYGKKPPPLEITDARGVPKEVKLEVYRGKWVLLEFWAVWCGPCVVNSLPELTKFYRDYASARERFEILTVCDTSKEKVRTIEEYDALSAHIVKNVWGGHPLPCPVLVDGDGKTSQAFGVVQRPTIYLIDPEGNLVKNGSLEMLIERLQETRKAH